MLTSWAFSAVGCLNVVSTKSITSHADFVGTQLLSIAWVQILPSAATLGW